MNAETKIQVFANRIPEEDAATAIAALPDDVTTDELAELYQHIDWFLHQSKRLKEALEERMKGIIKATGKAIEWKVDSEGNVQKFWLGHSRTTKCRNVDKTLDFFFTNLSASELSACLSAKAIKHGAFRKLLKEFKFAPELFEEHFEVTVEDKLETGETIPKELQSLNTRFLT